MEDLPSLGGSLLHQGLSVLSPAMGKSRSNAKAANAESTAWAGTPSTAKALSTDADASQKVLKRVMSQDDIPASPMRRNSTYGGNMNELQVC